MANVDVASGIGAGLHQSSVATLKQPYTQSVTFTWEAAVTAKGSALAAADVIQCLDVPAGTMILGGAIKKTEAPTGTVSVCTLDLGTGVDVDAWCDGFDYYAATVGDWSQAPAAWFPITNTAADTVDVVIATLTGTLLTGDVTVTVVVVDLEKPAAPGLAALGS